MDPILNSLGSTDISQRIEATQDLNSILSSSNDLFEDHVARQIPVAVQANIAHANVKLSQPSLTIVPNLVSYINRHYQHQDSVRQSLLVGFLSCVAEKLSDSKPQMRTAALTAVACLATAVGAKKALLALKDSITHKNWRVREGVILALLNLFFDESNKATASFRDAESLTSAINTAVIFLDDANREVRELAVRFLEQSYKLDRAVRSIVKSAIQQFKIQYGNAILQKFDSLDSASFSVDAESQSLVPDVKPIVITTESDMKNHFQQIEKQLSASDSDWDKRVEGIQHLQAIILGGATKIKGFYQLLKSMEEPIHSQLREARSTALKEACNLVSLLARNLGAQFAAMFEVYLATLLRSVCVTIQIISDSADYCIQNVLRFTPVTPSTLQQILQTTQTSKHNTIRIKCSYYVLQLIADRNLTNIEKHIELFEAALLRCVTDPAPQVRVNSRLAFIAFSRRWPERAPKLLASFESSVKSSIAKDEANGSADQQLAEIAAFLCSGSFKRTVSANPTTTPRAVKSVSSKTAGISGLGLSGPSRVPSSGSIAPAASATAVSSALQQPATLVAVAPAPALVRPALIAPKLGQPSAATVAAPPPTTPSVRSAAQRIPLASGPALAAAPALAASTELPVSYLGGAVRVPAPALIAPKLNTIDTTVESVLLKRPPMSAKKSVAAQTAFPQTPNGGLQSRPSRFQQNVAESPAPAKKLATSTSAAHIGLDEAQVFTMIMLQINHQDWNERAKAILCLRERLMTHEGSKKFQSYLFSSDTRLDRLAQAISLRLGDSHFKVTQYCVDLLLDLFTIVPETTMDAWLNDRILPPVLALQKDEKSKALAQTVLSALLERAGEVPTQLLASALRAVELAEIKTKQGALKFLVQIFNYSPFEEYLTGHFSSSNMQVVLKKLSRYGRWETSNELRQAMLDLLIVMAENYSTSFSAVFMTAGFANQDDLLRKIRAKCSKIPNVAFEASKVAEPQPQSSAAMDASARRARLGRTKSVGKAPSSNALPKSVSQDDADSVQDIEIQDDETSSNGSLGDVNSVLSLPPIPDISTSTQPSMSANAPKTPITPRRTRSQHFTPAEARAEARQQENLQRSAPKRQPLTPVPRKSASKPNGARVGEQSFFSSDNILAGTPLEVLEFASQQHRTEQKLEIRQGLRRAEDIMQILMNRENMTTQSMPRQQATAPTQTQQRSEVSFADILQKCQRLSSTLTSSIQSIQEMQSLFSTGQIDASNLERLLSSIPDLFPAIEKAVSSTDAAVRRGAVMCLVDMRILLGAPFDAKLQSLSDTSQRLVKLYMKQRMNTATTATARVV